MKIAIQGLAGSYTHTAASILFPAATLESYLTFDEAFAALETTIADYAVLPLENSTMGRVADVHHLLPHIKAQIVGEAFLPIEHALLAHPGTQLEDLEHVYSMAPALYQCHFRLRDLQLTRHECADTAQAAQQVAQMQDKTCAAIASLQAGALYGLEPLIHPLNDNTQNMTRFLIWARQQEMPPPESPAKTALFFQIKSMPAALFYALSGFAAHHVNLIKLESYFADHTFQHARFFAEIEGHADHENVQEALHVLSHYTEMLHILGTYKKADVPLEASGGLPHLNKT